jgi:hypothetical protein
MSSIISRLACLGLLACGLAPTTGCNSCFGGNSCRQPGLLEFRGMRQECCPEPACAPACNACGSVSTPCCGSAMAAGPMAQATVIEGGVVGSPMVGGAGAPEVIGTPTPARSAG